MANVVPHDSDRRAPNEFDDDFGRAHSRPKGMDPAVVKTLHDAFRKAMDDPKHMEVLAQLNQEPWYRSSDDYRSWAVATFAKEKALIERQGLAAK